MIFLVKFKELDYGFVCIINSNVLLCVYNQALLENKMEDVRHCVVRFIKWRVFTILFINIFFAYNPWSYCLLNSRCSSLNGLGFAWSGKSCPSALTVCSCFVLVCVLKIRSRVHRSWAQCVCVSRAVTAPPFRAQNCKSFNRCQWCCHRCLTI